MSVLRRINIRIEIYLDNMLLIDQTMKEILLSRDTVIFLLLHNLEFVLNLKKSIVNPVQEIEFLGITKKYLKMCLSLQQKFLTTRTDAYEKAYGAACHPTPTGGNVIYRNNDFILIYWKRKQ